ncbi:MAG: hypothetical protein H0U03_14780 [Actinobacteria bacterium]|nr:hypothetical protein [Actinomycetota bacterium]
MSAIRIALLASALAILFVGPLDRADAGESRRVSSYCSKSGDLCFGIFEQKGRYSFQIDTFARYFGRYRLCVRPPRGAELCRSFPIAKKGKLFGSTVRWERNYPNRGTGRYRVTWKLASGRLGPTLVFRYVKPA